MTQLSTRKELLGSFKEYLETGGEDFTSIGDVLKSSEGVLEGNILIREEAGLPVLVGLKEGEQPYIVDLVENTSTIIVGGSGSGKTWFLNSLLLNLFTTNDYEDLNVYMFDRKNTPHNNAFSEYPHVKKYVTDLDEHEKMLEDIESLRKSRQQLLNDLGAERLQDYRESLLEKKEYEKLKEVPEILVVVDEYTALKAVSDEREDGRVIKMLDELSARGRSAGIRLVVVGQRANGINLTKTLNSNSSVKIGFRNLNKQDLDELYGKAAKEVKEPKTVGEFLIKSVEGPEVKNVKALTVGGRDNREQLDIIKNIGDEWNRRKQVRDSE